MWGCSNLKIVGYYSWPLCCKVIFKKKIIYDEIALASFIFAKESRDKHYILDIENDVVSLLFNYYISPHNKLEFYDALNHKV